MDAREARNSEAAVSSDLDLLTKDSAGKGSIGEESIQDFSEEIVIYKLEQTEETYDGIFKAEFDKC